MRLRSHLLLLAFGIAVPLLCALAAAGVALFNSERDAFIREAMGRTRSAMTTVDRDLNSTLTTLMALAASQSLERGDLRAFHAEVVRVLPTQHGWRNVGLASADRRQLVDAIVPFGTPLEFKPQDDSYERVIQTRKPAVGDIAAGALIAQPSVRIRIPVIIDGELRYVLAAAIDPAAFLPLLKAQLPDGGIIGLIDRKHRFIARLPEMSVGTPVSQAWEDALASAPEGWYRGATREGVDSYTAYVTSVSSGWTLGIAYPASVIDAGAWRSVWIAAAGIAIAAALALVLATLISRRIVRPIRALAESAANIDAPVINAEDIAEIGMLQDALVASASAAREREVALESVAEELRNQTELLQQQTSEAETLMQVMPIAIFKAEDRGSRFLTGNAAAYEFLGLTGQDGESALAVGQLSTDFKVFRDGREVPEHELPMQIAARTGIRPQAEELEFRFPDGKSRVGFVHVSPLFDAQGEPRGAVAAVLDVTDRKEAERRKDEFLATLSHELRNPLAAIISALELLGARSASAETDSRSRRILGRQAHLMKRLIDDLLDVSRIGTGKLELRPDVVELKTIVDNAVDGCRNTIDAMGHRLKVDIPANPVWVRCDAARISQLLMNLLGNACKFTPRGGTIELSAGCRDRTVTFRVADNGVGIGAHQMPRIFDMFMQGDQSLERSHGGLGIGLTLVKRLAELHGGRVEARSAGPNKGSEFIVTLPIVADANARPIAKPAQTQRSPRIHRVLIVDDNRDAAESLSAVLRLSGYEVHTAQDGVQGFEAAEKIRPEVIVTDIGMPEMNGYDLAKLIRTQPWGRSIRLIAVTGWGQEADRRKSVEAGFDGHLTKPVEAEELTAMFSARAGEALSSR